MSGIQLIGIVGISLIIGCLGLIVAWMILDIVVSEHRHGEHATLIFLIGLVVFLVVLYVLGMAAKGELG